MNTLTQLDLRLLNGEELDQSDIRNLGCLRFWEERLDREFTNHRWKGNNGSQTYITIPEVFDGDQRLSLRPEGYNRYVLPQPLQKFDRFRLLFLAGYLLEESREHLDIRTGDMRMFRRLVCELRRYGAREQGKLPIDVELNKDLVTSYCTNYRLGELTPIMFEQLGL